MFSGALEVLHRSVWMKLCQKTSIAVFKYLSNQYCKSDANGECSEDFCVRTTHSKAVGSGFFILHCCSCKMDEDVEETAKRRHMRFACCQVAHIM